MNSPLWLIVIVNRMKLAHAYFEDAYESDDIKNDAMKSHNMRFCISTM